MKIPLIFVGIYVFLAGLLAIRVPLNRAPDEGAHIYYVQYLATTGTLPIFKPTKPDGNPGYEFHQPPLYYSICALVWNVSGPGVQNYICRLVSILFGAATVALVWDAARRLFNESIAAYSAGFAAIWPLHLNVGAFAGNDAAAGFFCALMLYLIARSAGQGPPSLTTSVGLGVTCGLAMLTKSSCLTIAVAVFGWVIHASLRGGGRQSALHNAMGTIVASAIVCGPWLIRNNSFYGDPLALKAFDEAFRGASPGPSEFLGAGVGVVTYVQALISILFCTFWGAFGGPNTALQLLNPLFGGPSPRNVSFIMPSAMLLLVCAAASVTAVLGLSKDRPMRHMETQKRIVMLWWLVGAAAVLLAWANFNLTYFQAQARYLHPALLPMAILAAYGWQVMIGRTRGGPILTALFACVLLAFTYLNLTHWRTLV